ncbi:putative chromatin remodeling & transcriptional activation CHROMO-DOMAIN family [Rosa chinensis]|uniref:Putative chromatin remodeling & transcriptional activation CHROMO-DOMAIN family n=1 Tax=Rosa chinensis TaxID=74649 RepID=A0A2P6Q0N9_ROSCH|nr:protein MRG1 isoform X1 [Rosa chinensis]PRQ27742.1 putative chromatin remodeling & transcriptional activation CHROMO-DOMAIN family [Rosa chinensis]
MGHSKSDDDDDVTTDSSATESDTSATKTDSGIEHENDDVSSPSSDSCPFVEGEKVLAYHNTHIYDAKVIKTQFKNEWRFFIHYLGWNKNWDEWVRLDRLLKYTEENVEKQKLARMKDGTDKNPKLSRTSQTKLKSYNGARGKKRKNDSVVKGAIRLEELVIRMPHALRKQLVDDCESVTHLGKLVKLPRTPNVDDILKKYLEYRSNSDDLKAHSVEEILKGLCCYFDKALPVMLLYKNERPQYEKAIADNVSPSSVYGAEHLLRLFVKLPELLVEANIEEETLKELLQRLADFLKFLHKNQSAFFLSSYHVPEDTEISTNKQDD